MMMVMVFCSAPTSVSICMRRSSSSRRAFHDDFRSLGQLLSCFEFGLRLDQTRAFFAQSFRFLRHDTLHGLRDLDVLHLDALDFDAPRFGHCVDFLLNEACDGLLLLQHLVKRMLSDPVAKCRQRDLNNCGVDILDFQYRRHGIDDPVPHHGVHLDRDVVLGDGFLLLDRSRINAQINSALPFEHRNDPIKTRPFGRLIAPEPKHNTAHILIGNAQAAETKNYEQYKNDFWPNRHGPLPS